MLSVESVYLFLYAPIHSRRLQNADAIAKDAILNLFYSRVKVTRPKALDAVRPVTFLFT